MSEYLNNTNGVTYTEEEIAGYAKDDGVTVDRYMQDRDFTLVQPKEEKEEEEVVVAAKEDVGYDFSESGLPTEIQPFTQDLGPTGIDPNLTSGAALEQQQIIEKAEAEKAKELDFIGQVQEGVVPIEEIVQKKTRT